MSKGGRHPCDGATHPAPPPNTAGVDEPMISVEEAQARILASAPPPLANERVALDNALGRVLAADVIADGPMPPFTNTSMDGYAVRAEDTRGASDAHPVVLTVDGSVAAGHPWDGTLRPGHCVKIMTGAPLPATADAVVQVEWTAPHPANPDAVRIHRPVRPGQNLRYAGEDMQPGQVVLTQGTPLSPSAIGILATVGATDVWVRGRPRVAIIATGDELVEPGTPLAPGTIRNSNSYALAAAVRASGGDPVILPPAPDDLDAIRDRLRRAQTADVIVSSGGVSVGDFDLVKRALETDGRLNFWRVNMKPGKPVVFGHFGSTPFFGLPGNPVSALITFELFVRPLLLTLEGHLRWQRLHCHLPLAHRFDEITDRRHYVRSRLVQKDGQLMVAPHLNQGSAIQTSWTDVEALMIVEENTGPWDAGTLMPVVLLR